MTEAVEENQAKEPPIILLGFGRNSYYLYKGDEFLDDVLLADGVFPTPILCVHFESILGAKQIFGDGFATNHYWAVHEEIVERLRTNKQLVETDA